METTQNESKEQKSTSDIGESTPREARESEKKRLDKSIENIIDQCLRICVNNGWKTCFIFSRNDGEVISHEYSCAKFRTFFEMKGCSVRFYRDGDKFTKQIGPVGMLQMSNSFEYFTEQRQKEYEKEVAGIGLL